MTAFGKPPTEAQAWQTLGAAQTEDRTQRGVLLTSGQARLAVSVLAANIVRVRMTPAGAFLPQRSWAVTRDETDWPAAPFELRSDPAAIEIETAHLRVRIERATCQVACFDKEGRPFAQDAGPGMAWRQGSTAGWKRIEPDEHFYGFGERTGLLERAGERKTNWTVDAVNFNSTTDNMYQAIPFFLALRPEVGYGVFFSTTFWSQFDIGAEQPGCWRMETHAPELDYYLIYGPDAATILGSYSELTGRMSLPPRWAMGYHQCRWSYNSADEVRDLAREFRERRIPCDVIHLDIDYMRGYRVFTWSPKRFADPAGLVADLQRDGFKTVTIIDPGVKYEPEADYAVFDQGIANDYFVRKADGQLFHGYVWPDKAVFPDFLRPDVRAWWGEQHRSLTEIGVAGIWNDMNEPAINERPFGDGLGLITFPLDAPQGPADERTTHAETHNLYGLSMARASREALQTLRPERSFVLTRSGYAGIQRWSAVWLGDNQSLWEHLEQSLPMLCNMGLSGVPFVGCDIGGFAGNASGELFARWMQIGVLYPFMRGHSALGSERHEPWAFGERIERICREYIELRYRLLPYLYTLFWEATTTGAPILRPLLYHFQADPQTVALHDQVMLGPALMAAPIYRPGATHRAVYLPEGGWYDWWSGQRYDGPTHILAHAPLERMPLYVRAGSIIALGPVMQHADERPLDDLTLRVWPGDSTWTLYEDDGQSFAHQQGQFATTTVHVHSADGQPVVELAAREGQYSPPPRTITVELVGVGEQRFDDDGSARSLTF